MSEVSGDSVSPQESEAGQTSFRLVDSRQAEEELLLEIARMWSTSEADKESEDRLDWLKARQRDLVLGFSGEELAGYTILTPMAGVIEQKLAKAPKGVSQIVRRMTRLLPKVYGLSEIMVSPKYRRQGLARKLAEFGSEQLSPDLLIAQTKNPAVVWAQAVTGQEEYRTFFGNDEILSGDARPLSRLKRRGLKAIFDLTVGSEHYQEDLYQVPENHLPSDIPDVSRFDPSVQKAFANLISAQDKLGGKATLVKPLISIRRRK